jgi:hypothetical protein
MMGLSFRGTRRDVIRTSTLQAVKSWQAVAMFFRAHGALFGFQPDRDARRLLYALFAALITIGWYGFVAGYPMLSDRFTPLVWAAAAAACIVGAINVDSPTAWVASGTTVLMACGWRALSLLWFEFTGAYPSGQAGSSLIAVAFAGWSMATVGVVAIWGAWLRPDQ